jgi:nitrogen fixation/metabolism regulation signal transduction histidine kinase
VSFLRLKDRLLTAFFIMIAMPIMLLCIAAGTIISFQTNSIQESYDVEADTVQVITNPIQILNRLTRGIYNEIKLTALKEPQKLENAAFIQHLNEELMNRYSFIALRKNSEFVYAGNEEMLDGIKGSLQKFGEYNTDVDGGMYVNGRKPFLVKSQDFYFTDGAEGTIFIITDLNTLFPQIKALASQTLISFLLILIFTAMMLMLWIYRGILKPLNILRIGMSQIKDGDLEYSVQSETEDEIGQLCEDFEEMRIRLKELIDNRLKYEEDIKELISNISHDLKTPLTAIQGYAEGLIDGVAGSPEKQEKYLQTILSKANDMAILVDELAFYAKIDCNTIIFEL